MRMIVHLVSFDRSSLLEKLGEWSLAYFSGGHIDLHLSGLIGRHSSYYFLYPTQQLSCKDWQFVGTR